MAFWHVAQLAHGSYAWRFAWLLLMHAADGEKRIATACALFDTNQGFHDCISQIWSQTWVQAVLLHI